MRLNTTRWITLVVLTMLCGTAIAGDPNSAQKDTAALTTELLTPVQQRMQQEISVDFKDTPIDDVLMILAKQANVDIIKSPKVIGTVTATLTEVPLSEALENILTSQGYAYIATQNMIRIVPKEDILETREKKVSRVYRITYANVKEVEESLKKFISQDGSISSNPGTSNIIVTDVESKVNAINSFIDEIDRVTPQIMVEARIYDVTSKDRLDLGIQWLAGTATTYGADVPATGKTDPFTTGIFNGTTNKTDSTSGLVRFGYLDENLDIDAIIHAEQEDIRAKLLANPRIMVLDNQLAEIKIVEEIPYQELTQTSGGGNIGTTQFRDVGVELRVTPHLTRDGLIRLILNPVFSIRTGDVLIPGSPGIANQPIVAKRETTTTALIKDQQTVVIGGLKKQDVNTQVNKIPLLGDLPLLGALFRFRGESTVNSELVIFITPTIINEPILGESEKRQLESTNFESPREPEPKKLSKAE